MFNLPFIVYKCHKVQNVHHNSPEIIGGVFRCLALIVKNSEILRDIKIKSLKIKKATNLHVSEAGTRHFLGGKFDDQN